jgi:Rieske Fe-S protein
MSNDELKSSPRRDFLGIAVGGSATVFAVAAGYPVARFIEPRTRPPSGPTVVGKVLEFPPGTVKSVMVDERPVLVVRAADGQFRAFSALCSHLQCVVGYSPERNQIECPCHRGVYSMDGVNIGGPPPRPLEELQVSVNEGSIIVSAVG